MAAGGGIYVAQEGLPGIGAKPGVDGAGFDQADVHAAAREFQAQGIGIAFQRELAGVVGATNFMATRPSTELFCTMRPSPAASMGGNIWRMR